MTASSNAGVSAGGSTPILAAPNVAPAPLTLPLAVDAIRFRGNAMRDA